MRKDPQQLGIVSFAAPSASRDLSDTLRAIGFRTVTLPCGEPALSGLSRTLSAAVIVHIDGTDHPAPETVLRISAAGNVPILGVLAAGANIEAMAWLELCSDIAFWPCAPAELALRIQRLLSRTNTAGALDTTASPIEIVGRSPVFLDVLRQLKRIATCDAPVLIEGDTGTGKEMAARAIHYHSARESFPFIPVNCGALPDDLVENELFGHERGAYTDAKNARPGLVAQASGGTLFIDEVEALSSKGQVTLLRFLQDQFYKPLGSDKYQHANVRVVAASNVPLAECVRRGTFRQDLLFRLDVMSVTMPPLSQRLDDIEVLAEFFMEKLRRKYRGQRKVLHPDALTWMRGYPWPGNVRELENMIHRGFILAEGQVVTLAHAARERIERRAGFLDRRRNLPTHTTYHAAKEHLLVEFERSYLQRVMMHTRGNVTQAAKLAGKERRAFDKLLRKQGIDKTAFRELTPADGGDFPDS